jgi:hypothetical protein
MRASATPVPRASGSTKRSFITPMRAAERVDHDQNNVANPMAAAPLPASDELDSISNVVLQQRPRQVEKGQLRGRDAVEVAVRAHERQQVVEVGIADHGDDACVGYVLKGARVCHRCSPRPLDCPDHVHLSGDGSSLAR